MGSNIDKVCDYILNKSLRHLGFSEEEIGEAREEVKKIAVQYDSQPYGTLFLFSRISVDFVLSLSILASIYSSNVVLFPSIRADPKLSNK